MKIRIDLILAATLIVAAIVWGVVQWRTCRAEGLSVLYCVQHVT